MKKTAFFAMVLATVGLPFSLPAGAQVGASGSGSSASTGTSGGASGGSYGGATGGSAATPGMTPPVVGGAAGKTLSKADAQQSGINEQQFAALDINHDGKLDEQELAKAGLRFRSGGG